jgi:hypothetical protein
MKIEELRIGNLVKNGLGEFIIIKNNINERNTGGYFLITLEPVPLTEDLVIDLGLKPVELENGEWFYQDSKFRLNKNYAGFYYSKNLDIKYVHQLQNLYFALTGSELQYVA